MPLQYLAHLVNRLRVLCEQSGAVHLKLRIGEGGEQCVETFALVAHSKLACLVELATEADKLLHIEIRLAHLLHRAIERQQMVGRLGALLQSPVVCGEQIGCLRIMLAVVACYRLVHIGVRIVHEECEDIGLHIVERRVASRQGKGDR